jgi:chromosome segregation ATPase
MVAPQGDSPEARLAALEQQRRNDQQVMEHLVNAINEIRVSSAEVKEKAKEHDAMLQGQTQMGMTLRQEVFAARAELASGVSTASDAAQAAAMAQMAVQVENKFSELDKMTANLSHGLETLGLRGQRVEQVVEQQVAGQPNTSR